MIGITLSPEQIRSAPPEVRRWLEQEISSSLGLAEAPAAAAQPATPQPEPPHLVACSPEEVAAIHGLIRGVLPATNVFFELGRAGGRALPNGLRVFGLLDIMSHSRLQTPNQVLTCLEMIDGAMRQVRHDPLATLYGVDDRANCFIAEATHRGIEQLWQQLIGGEPAAPRGAVPGVLADGAMMEPVAESAQP